MSRDEEDRRLAEFLSFEGCDDPFFDGDAAWREWYEWRVVCEAAKTTACRWQEERPREFEGWPYHQLFSLAFLAMAERAGARDNRRVRRVAEACRVEGSGPPAGRPQTDPPNAREWMHAMLFSEDQDAGFQRLCRKYDRRGVRGRLRRAMGR